MYPVSVVIFFIYLSTVLLPYVDTGKYWFLSIVGLGFTILLLLVFLLLIFWIIMRSRIMWILSLLVILAGARQIKAAIAFHFPASFKTERSGSTIRVMQWNVHNWNQILFENERLVSENTQPDMMQMISRYDPDVLCIEEFFESNDRKKLRGNIEDLKSLGYQYFYFLHGQLQDDVYYTGISIFSKFPIKESGRAVISKNQTTDPLAYADILINGKTIRFIAIHLQSVRFESTDYQTLSNMKKTKDPNIHGSKTILSKLKAGFQKRYEQAVNVNNMVVKSPYPVIVCGDFNDVPNSGTYFTITKNLQDAFLKKGSFIGRTFRYISPTLRIDYILPDKTFEVKQFQVIHVPYSDHYPLVADLDFKK